jgi:hypothetical protein
MFRNPVYDLIVVIPALLISGLFAFFIMTSSARAQELDAIPAAATTTNTGAPAVTASTSGNTLPDRLQTVLMVSRADLPASAGDDATLTPLAIHSSTELHAYARTTLRNDLYIESLTLSGREVTVAYRTHGWLLGLVPVVVPTRAAVRTDGSVIFTAPWYGAVTLAQKDLMKTALEVRVHALLTSEGYLESMSLAPATQAEIIDIIRELLA